ncbi:MAG: hypothetical protein HDQ97_09060 [Lachnospiraceae bacterium]|nr:hypothetical protein [Lachnospiraceae bacterium]
MKVTKSDHKEINEVIRHLWAAVDQAQIMDLVEFAFENLPYKLKKDVLKELFDYASQDGNKSGIIKPEELKEWLERAEKII